MRAGAAAVILHALEQTKDRKESEMHTVRSRRTALAATIAAVGLVSAAATAVVDAKPAKSGKLDTGTIYTGETRTVGMTHYQAGMVADRLFGSGAVTFASKITITSPTTINFT